jgi:hypothetical protein
MPKRSAKRASRPVKDAEDELEDDEETDDETPSEPDNARPTSRAEPRSGIGVTNREPRTYSPVRLSENAGDAELIDFSAWPGVSEAAKIAGVHPTTIKNWRNAGRIRAELNPATGCWHYDPDSLVEIAGNPEPADPATLLATGMTSIVQQGERAGARLLAMTELSTQGLVQANEILSTQLEAAYVRIDQLEKKLESLFDRTATSMEASYKHERYLRRIDHEHEMAMSEKRDGSDRLRGLLEILGPIGASIAARVVGNERAAQTAEAKAISQTNGTAGIHESIESKITFALGELATSIKALDGQEFEAFRLMLPEHVGKALVAIRNGEGDGAALALVAKMACDLSKDQYEALSPLAPKGVSVALGRLRELMS